MPRLHAAGRLSCKAKGFAADAFVWRAADLHLTKLPGNETCYPACTAHLYQRRVQQYNFGQMEPMENPGTADPQGKCSARN
jgi:hypothetical protein